MSSPGQALRVLQAVQPKPVPPSDMADMRLMRIEDVAAALGINYRTVREWGQKGRIPTIKIGRFAFVRVAALRQWVADNERGGSNG